MKTWQEYWIQNGYGFTVGKLGGGSLLTGSLDPAHPYNPSSTSKRYKLPGNAAPVWNEAGNIDPAVLNEWAAAHGVKIETPAGATEQQDLKYVADGNGKTWYEAVLRPWTIAREQGGEVTKPVEGGDKGLDLGLLLALPELVKLVRGLKEGFDGLEDGVLDVIRDVISDRLRTAFSTIDANLRTLADQQVAQHKALLAEVKALKNQVAKLAKGKP